MLGSLQHASMQETPHARHVSYLAESPLAAPPSPRRSRPDTSQFREFLGSQGQAALLLNPALALTILAPNDLR